ncbi:uncharacterized protein UBRO_20817 [Ustilago bromivora]|uniref:DDE Tnp4 domain-containing protein n=1 Tax=Ustilago bromivora TaxID=307758 RepID=A0A1K0G8W9_9BASI|nr:uncharacterized protein UBRO_20817 [Ustilago bromivora]
MVDRMLVPLQFTPGMEGHFDWKKNYSLNIQLVVLPHNLKINEYVVGCPGSTHDSSTFAKSDIFKNPHHYLAKGEWIWAHLGYGLSEHIVSPYGRLASLASEEFQQFNKAVSNIRIQSEHAIGYLKGCFQALRGMWPLIWDKDTHTSACQTVIAMLVVHNIALEFDVVDDYAFYAGQDLSAPEATQLTQSIQHHQEEENWLYLEEQVFLSIFVSRHRWDKYWWHKARLVCEALHKALFRGRGLVFRQTTEESWLQEKTKECLCQR